jgi:Asp/Glu/hydantoin racemase
MPKLAIIHTTPVTVGTLKQLAAEMLPDYTVVNFVDDSILPQLIENGGNLSEVQDRVTQYAHFAEQVGADIILSACSSVGELVATMREQVNIPVVRIDEAMAEEAVRKGSNIGVAATLSTTLRPTMQLIQRKAEEAGREINLTPRLVDAAYARLMAGDAEGHDALLSAALEELAAQVDVVVLAQASMARVLSRLPEGLRDKFLTSPQLGMQRVKTTVEAGK